MLAQGKDTQKHSLTKVLTFSIQTQDAAGLGAYEAAENAQADGKTVYTFGANLDKSKISPNTVLANAVVTPTAFLKIAKLVKEGKFKEQIYTFNMLTENAIKLTYNPDLKDKIPQDVLDAVEAAKSKILSGELEVKQIDFTEEN